MQIELRREFLQIFMGLIHIHKRKLSFTILLYIYFRLKLKYFLLDVVFLITIYKQMPCMKKNHCSLLNIHGIYNILVFIILFFNLLLFSLFRHPLPAFQFWWRRQIMSFVFVSSGLSIENKKKCELNNNLIRINYVLILCRIRFSIACYFLGFCWVKQET